MKNIVFYVKLNSGVKGGIEKLVAELSNSLKDRFNVYVLCDSFKGAEFPYFLEKEVHKIHLPFRANGRFILSLRKLLHSISPDCVVVMRTGGNVMEVFAAAMKGMAGKLVMSEHCAPSIAINEYKNTTRETCLFCADYIHLLLEGYKNSVPASIKNRVKIIPNFCDNKFAKVDFCERKNQIVMVGRLTKNQKTTNVIIRSIR